MCVCVWGGGVWVCVGGGGGGVWVCVSRRNKGTLRRENLN